MIYLNAASAPDPFLFQTHGSLAVETYNYDGRTMAHVPALAAGNTAVIIAAGQSNISNRIDGTYSPSNTVHNFSLQNGAVYTAQEPLLSCDSNPPANIGNWLFQFADLLITDNYFDNVILLPIAVGSSAIADWAPGGALNYRFGLASRRLASRGLAPDFFLWMQGESDNLANTSQADYTTRGQSLFASVRSAGISCPIFISQTTWISGTTDANVQAAQAALVDNPNGIFAGPDTDTLDNTNRYDTTHLNATGRNACAALWRDVIEDYIDTH